MIIGLNASKITEAKNTGIGKTVSSIVTELAQIKSQDQIYLYSPKPLPEALLSNPRFTAKIIPFRRLWHSLRLPLALKRDKPDVFLELSASIPSFAPAHSFVLIHDLAFKHFPEAYSPKEGIMQDQAIQKDLKHGATLIVTTEANKQDLLQFYPEAAERQIAVIPLGFTPIEKPDNSKTNLAPYFLSVGRLEKRKNTLLTIQAFDLFKTANPESEIKLILVGKDGFGADEIHQAVEHSPFKADIQVKGYLSDQELAELYYQAEALLYPSLYEGFGYPMLEAMSTDLPVICSDVPTLREVGGDAPLYINPQDPAALAQAMSEVLHPATRKEMIAKGRNVIKNYSWAKTAQKIYDLLKGGI